MTSVAVYYPGEWHVGGAEALTLSFADALAPLGEVRLLVTAVPEQRRLRENLALSAEERPVELLPSAAEAVVRHAAAGSDLFVNCSPWSFVRPPSGSASIFLTYYAPELPRQSRAGVVSRRIAALPLRRRISFTGAAAAVRMYDAVLCSSSWTAALVRERWQRDAEVLYPPVRMVPPAPEADRTDTVLTVGRIGAGGTDKGHRLAAGTFRRVSLDGWGLCIAGASNYREAAAEEDALREIGGADVSVRADPDRREVEHLYGTSRLYWHFAGHSSLPGSVHNEHFGISVVEAMSAGSVPLAYASAGPSEILAGIDYCLWGSLDEVVDKTRELASKGQLRQDLAAECRRRADDFRFERFERDAVEQARRLLGERDRRT